MRILLLTQYFPPEIGAAQARLSAFGTELSRMGHSVDVITAFPNYPLGRLAPSDRLRISRTEVSNMLRVRRVWHLPATGAGARRLASYLSFTISGSVAGLASRRPDLVFVESPPLFLGLSGLLIARRFRARFVLNISDLWPDSIRDLGLMADGVALRSAERLERWLYGHADAVTAVTEGIRTRLVEQKGVPPGKVLFMPNGVDDVLLSGKDAEEALLPFELPDPPIALYAGNHGHAHALDSILKAAQLIPDVNFVLVGAGSEKERLIRASRDLQLTNVCFFDPVPPSLIPKLYAHAAVGLSTVRNVPVMAGARPAKALAIMASGTPIVYAGVGEGARLVDAANAGIVVPPEDAAALAAAIDRVIGEPDAAREWGSNGRRFVQEHLSWPALTASWLEQLARIPRNRAKAAPA